MITKVIVILLGLQYAIQKLKNAIIYFNPKCYDTESIWYRLVKHFKNDVHGLEAITYTFNTLICFLIVLPVMGFIKALILALLVNQCFDWINKLANNKASCLPAFHEPEKEDKSILFMKVKSVKLIKGKYRVIWGFICILVIILI